MLAGRTRQSRCARKSSRWRPRRPAGAAARYSARRIERCRAMRPDRLHQGRPFTRLHLARQCRLPSLPGVGKSSLSDVFTHASLIYTAGPSFQWNILNYGQITNNVRVQDAKFQELLISLSEHRAQGPAEKSPTASQLSSESRAASIYLRQASKRPRRRPAHRDDPVRQGSPTSPRSSPPSRTFIRPRTTSPSGEGHVPLGLIAAYRAMGGGWQIREGHNFIPPETAHEMEDRTNWELC